MIALYVHIPYCRTICPYCDFVRTPCKGPVPDGFLDALCAEIEHFEGPSQADTIFLGGGTPSLLAPGQLDALFGALHRRFTLHDPEISIEANPDDLTPELADTWKGLGVNRVSLGVQSFDDRVLRYLGRRHDADGARRACGIIAERFPNWSLDLMFGAPPLEAWETTLRECAALNPPHVSAYGLTYEMGTPFEARSQDAVDDDAYLRLYRQADDVLCDMERYEISNFARTGFECRHNLRYWHNEEYAGFGPGAYSFIDGVRARNAVETPVYLAQPGEKTESLPLSDAEIRVETLIQHFRLKTGLPEAYYTERFGRSLRDDFGTTLNALIERGLLIHEEETCRPTALGFELNNEIGLALVG